MMSDEEITVLDRENPMVPGGDLDEETLIALNEALKDMKGPVKAMVFIKQGCHYCFETIKLMDHYVKSSPIINGEHFFQYDVYTKGKDDELFKKYGVTRVPTVAFINGLIRYTGIPSGEEIRSLVETIIRISEGESGLEEETKRYIRMIKKDTLIEVIVTPACPYCPYAVLLANMIAFESYKQGLSKIIADTVEAYENPDIADKYNVKSVPAIAINSENAFVGLPYEHDFIKRINSIAGQ